MKVIYLMGAGRSGTTALATFLNRSPDVVFLGELHHLPDYAVEDRACSCGAPISKCSFWNRHRDATSLFSTGSYRAEQSQFEAHRHVLRYLNPTYASFSAHYEPANRALLSSVAATSEKAVLDSAKYVGRALALSRSRDLDLRVIYLMRDPRGVVESFAKQVQTPKGLLSSCFYYVSINALAELARLLLRNRVLKIRYEDVLARPNESFAQIGQFCDIEVGPILETIEEDGSFEVGHIVGGNRLKVDQSIQIRTTDSWQEKTPFLKRIAAYLLTLPIALLNRYRI